MEEGYEEYDEVFEKILANKSLLPVIPDAGLKILSALNHPKGNAKMFAKVIESDMSLSGFILKTSRSLRYLTRVPPKRVEQAVARMGLRETYHLSLSFLSKSIFHSSNKQIEGYIKKAYRFSTKVAVISYFLAGKTQNLAPGDAMLAGLFQDIGVPSILATLDEYPNILQNDLNRTKCIDVLAPRVGALIIKKWGLDEMLGVVESRKNWWLDKEQLGLAELVLIARVHATIGTPEFRACPTLLEIPAFQKLQLGELGPDNTLQILSESKNELAEIERLLAA
ncbi:MULTISPECIES: HDOD domain-containing protein [Cycloclasticus]|uniref:Metal-dependent hydrolase HDOD n=1 Tax=Cycloclasticus pugetii TaxID=34068 RepID=A0AB33Z255_9GAMM|nr:MULTISPECIES: HDOD domain-containing protein [Cycloclasticus]ATI02106.1 HDOD domain-containing protein [Cycloclasticus sp. PY97N]EPD13148.1 metal-dependent hydrolase HDOD [Cycloclasticus pugetii]